MVREGGEWKKEGVVSKNFGHHGWPTTTNNNKNKPGQNALKQSQKKKKFGPKYKWFKNLIFGVPFLSLILRTSTHSTLEKICSHNIAKNLSHFTNFPANIWLVSKNFLHSTSTAPFLGAQELHSRSTLKANVSIFLYISVRKFLFQRRRKLLSDGLVGAK